MKNLTSGHIIAEFLQQISPERAAQCNLSTVRPLRLALELRTSTAHLLYILESEDSTKKKSHQDLQTGRV